MKCEFCGDTFIDAHSCKVDLNEIPNLRTRVTELEAKNSTLRLLLIEAQRTGTLSLDLNERINSARY